MEKPDHIHAVVVLPGPRTARPERFESHLPVDGAGLRNAPRWAAASLDWLLKIPVNGVRAYARSVRLGAVLRLASTRGARGPRLPGNLVGQPWRRSVRHNRPRRRTCAELTMLNERLLKDVGIIHDGETISVEKTLWE